MIGDAKQRVSETQRKIEAVDERIRRLDNLIAAADACVWVAASIICGLTFFFVGVALWALLEAWQ